ncbi:MAG: hypothetical protein JWQ04_1083 [Pedosphaera sp.]|nr:hypothetical protein [Pedosphaera sp.]
MKKLLYVLAVIALLSNTGCVFRDDRGGEGIRHDEDRGHVEHDDHFRDHDRGDDDHR